MPTFGNLKSGDSLFGDVNALLPPTNCPSSHGPLYQNEVKCSAFDMEMIFHFHANKTHFYKKGCALGLILKVRDFGTRKWPVVGPAYSNVFR